MFNIGILLLFIAVNFLLIAITYKLFGKTGLIAYMALSVIAANIQVSKELQMFDIQILGFNLGFATLGNVMFGGIFLTTDLLNEKYGEKSAMRAVYISIFANIAFVVVMAISTIFEGFVFDYAKDIDITDAYNKFFSFDGAVFKAMVVGNAVYATSQILDVIVYQKIRSAKPGVKFLWLRNNGSTFISQFVDTVLVTLGFCLVGIISFEYFYEVVLTTLVIKYLIALLDTPFMYLLNGIKPLDILKEE